MNEKERQNYWRRNIRITRRLEQKFQPSVHKVVKKTVDKFIENRYDVDLMDDELLAIYSKMYKETIIRFANEQYKSLRRTKQFGFNAEWTAFVTEYLATQGFTMITTVTGNLRNVILKIIAQATTEAVEQGLGIDETTRLIIERLTEFKESPLSEYIARRIVRTEINRAANLGHMKGAEKLEFQVVKMWIAARDERTRRMPRDQYSHVALDGQTRELNEPFRQIGMNGVEAVAMQPGDPTAPAGFTINCRCSIGFVPKRDANGRLIPKTNIIIPDAPKPVIRDTTPKPVGIPLEQTNGFSVGKNNRETARNLQNFIKDKTGLNIDKITIAKDLTKDEFDEKVNQLAKLFNEYRINEGLDKDKGIKLSFSSTKRFLGAVKHNTGITMSGRVLGKPAISEMNFGNRNERLDQVTFIRNSENTRFSSSINKENINLGVPTHEFAHVMAISKQINNQNTPEYIRNYFKELLGIKNRYVNEMLELNQKGDKQGVYNISLGRYASTNIDEFHAEAFKEYKLNSNPSKYALEVGRLIDKYFKK